MKSIKIWSDVFADATASGGNVSTIGPNTGTQNPTRQA